MAFADWECSADLSIMLWSGDYYSAPYSLLAESQAALDADFALCKAANTLDLAEGRIQFLYYAANINDLLPACCFRNQAAVASPSGLNCFFVEFERWKASLYVRVAGVNTNLGSWAAGFPAEYWRWCRLSWFVQGSDLVCELHVWHSVTGWSSLGQINTMRNDWSASGINRVGLGMSVCNCDGEDVEFDDFLAFSRDAT